jgi:hypothetical protein
VHTAAVVEEIVVAAESTLGLQIRVGLKQAFSSSSKSSRACPEFAMAGFDLTSMDSIKSILNELLLLQSVQVQETTTEHFSSRTSLERTPTRKGAPGS